MNKPIVVIHGPQGCGKTTHADALARHFGCTEIVYDWDGFRPLPAGALALTSAVSARLDLLEAARVVSYRHAAAEAGLLVAQPTDDVFASSPPFRPSDVPALWRMFQRWCRRPSEQTRQVGPAGSQFSRKDLAASD